jgi:hypothetical protein
VIAEQTDDEGDWVAQTCHLCELDFLQQKEGTFQKLLPYLARIVLKLLILVDEWLLCLFLVSRKAGL